MRREKGGSEEVPSVPEWFQDGFHRFLRRFLRRHFHTVAFERASRQELAIRANVPLIVFGNHPSWWDPLLAHFLNRTLFPERQFYAPIDADALQKYRVFKKLGFYGVRLQTISGAADFLRQSMAILRAGNTSIWMTPEGRFADVRDRTARLMPGLAHLCSKMDHGFAVPMAIEYAFWEERLPECLISMGRPIELTQASGRAKEDWSELLESALRATQDHLAQLVMARSAEPFESLLRGRAGAGRMYDFFRRFRIGRRGGGRFHHGDQFE